MPEFVVETFISKYKKDNIRMLERALCKEALNEIRKTYRKQEEENIIKTLSDKSLSRYIWYDETQIKENENGITGILYFFFDYWLFHLEHMNKD